MSGQYTQGYSIATNPMTTAEREELNRLRRENRQLKLERGILVDGWLRPGEQGLLSTFAYLLVRFLAWIIVERGRGKVRAD